MKNNGFIKIVMSYIIKKSGENHMKKRKINHIIGAFFALMLAVSVGTTLTFAKASQQPQIVLAEGEEESEEEASAPETPVSSEDDSAEPTEAQPSESGAATESGSESSSGEQSSQASSISGKSVLQIIFQILKDAIKDLIRHLDQWFMN